MMPGDSQSKTAATAADATVGNCQNCSVLHQSLTEYVSSFLALKQKINASDDTIRLQQQLEELQIRLVTHERKTADYEFVQAELEEKRGLLKASEQLLAKMEVLKQENSNALVENKKLEDQLKSIQDSAEKQSHENTQLRREKASVENDLLKTQAALKKSQAEAEKAEKLMEENVVMANMKDRLENKVRLLEDSICKQNHQTSQMTKEKILLERNISDLQVRLMKLERERCKEYRSTTTQTSATAEPKIDKEKVRMLLQSLWTCVEPEQESSEKMLLLQESSCRNVPPCSPQTKQKSKASGTAPAASQKMMESDSYLVQTKAIDVQFEPSPQAQDVKKHQASASSPRNKKKASSCQKKNQTPKQHKPDESSPNKSSYSVDEIIRLFKPMLPCISPLPDSDEVESLEMNDGGKDHPKPCDDLPFPVQENPLQINSPSSHSSPRSSEPWEEEKVESEVPTQERQHVPKEKDLEQNELCHFVKLKEKLDKDCEKVCSDRDIMPEGETASLPSPSAASAGKCLVEVFPSMTKTPEDSCCGKTYSSDADGTSETKCVSQETREDHLDSVTNMDAEPSLTKVPNATTVAVDGGESLTNNGVVTISEDEKSSRVSKCSESLNDISVTENVSGVEKHHLDSCQNMTNTTASKAQDSTAFLGTEMLEHVLPGSSDGMTCVSYKNPEDEPENGRTVQPRVCDDQNTEQEAGRINVTSSASDSNTHNETPTPSSKREEDDLLSDHGHGESTSDLKIDLGTEERNSKATSDSAPLFSDSPEKITDCTVLEENTQNVSETLSPTCSPLDPNTEKPNTDENTEPFSDNNDSSIPGGNEEDITNIIAIKELSQNSTGEGHDASNTDGTCEATHKKQCSPASQTSEFIGQARSEMGPPLPPVLTPLSTPPKAGKSINPRHAIEKLSFPSPMDHMTSPTTPVKVTLLPNSQQLSSSFLNSPTPPNGVPSSPLQFGSATPKHALPVPGRLPTKANNSSTSASLSPPQENSMKILDTMYPELSARARTLSILRGNVSLGICSLENGNLPTTTDGQVSSFKAVSSSSTAFIKTVERGKKRPADTLSQAKNNKCLKLEIGSADVDQKQVPFLPSSSGEETTSLCSLRADHLNKTISASVEAGEPAERNLLVESLEKINNQCFDLLPVVQSHLYVGNLPKKPILRDEEREVISEICESSSSQVDDMMLAILNKLKTEKAALSTNYTQALCRVYTGICRQKRFWEKAHILAYNILVEDFPDCAKLLLFMVTTWPTLLSHSSLLCQAIHAVTKLKAQEGLFSCLSKFLGWEKNPPCDIDQLISRTLFELRSASKRSFIKHSRYGEDLGTDAWEQIFTLHLLCSHKKWKWTFESVLGNELWPLMNTWVSQPRDQQEPVSDVTAATVLRLIGCLCQLGLKESCVRSVISVARVINTFGRHGQSEGVPWGVQLAAVYCIYNLSPCNPKQALDALAVWRGEVTESVPPAVTSYINQIASICRQIKS